MGISARRPLLRRDPAPRLTAAESRSPRNERHAVVAAGKRERPPPATAMAFGASPISNRRGLARRNRYRLDRHCRCGLDLRHARPAARLAPLAHTAIIVGGRAP